MQVATELNGRNERDAGLLQAGVDIAVFLLALLHVPARKTIFNLAVRPLVLFEDRHSDSAVRQYFRSDGARDRASDDGDEMLSIVRHRESVPDTPVPIVIQFPPCYF